MLSVIGEASRRALIESIVPRSIARARRCSCRRRSPRPQALAELRAIAKNQVFKSFIGQGYYGTHTPGVILRNILENPAWYTAYTPYQAEISQGRMEALVNFQTMVCDLTAMPIANASMLDEATAAAEAMTLAKRSVKSKSNTFVIAGDCHPQTIEVVRTRAAPLGIEVVLANSAQEWDQAMAGDFFAALIQYPASSGWVTDWAPTCRSARQAGRRHRRGRPAGADAAGAARRVGRRHRGGHHAALRHAHGRGGPHAAYLACRDEFKRSCRAGWSASASTATATRPTASRCRRASSTSGARRPRPTSARRRCCRRWSPACTPSTTGRRASSASRSAWPATPPSWPRAWSSWAGRAPHHQTAFDTLS
jgi:glycine dehydrogenase